MTHVSKTLLHDRQFQFQREHWRLPKRRSTLLPAFRSLPGFPVTPGGSTLERFKQGHRCRSSVSVSQLRRCCENDRTGMIEATGLRMVFPRRSGPRSVQVKFVSRPLDTAVQGFFTTPRFRHDHVPIVRKRQSRSYRIITKAPIGYSCNFCVTTTSSHFSATWNPQIRLSCCWSAAPAASRAQSEKSMAYDDCLRSRLGSPRSAWPKITQSQRSPRLKSGSISKTISFIHFQARPPRAC